MSPQLKVRVEEWLAEHGYPLELRVARALSSRCEVLQGEYFQDPKTKEAREIDVQADLELDEIELPGEKTLSANIRFLIECKSVRNHAWVGFERDEPLQVFDLLNSFQCSRSLELLLHEALLDVIGHPFPLREMKTCYGITTAFRDRSQIDLAHAATRTAQASAIAAAPYWDDLQTDALEQGVAVTHVCIPMVVTDAPLFAVRLGSEGAVTSEAVGHLLLTSKGTAVGPGKTLTFIVHEANLLEIVDLVEKSFAALLERVLGPDLREKAWSLVERPYMPDMEFQGSNRIPRVVP